MPGTVLDLTIQLIHNTHIHKTTHAQQYILYPGAFAQIEEADNKKMLINKLTTTTKNNRAGKRNMKC